MNFLRLTFLQEFLKPIQDSIKIMDQLLSRTTMVGKPHRTIPFTLSNSCQIQSLKVFQKKFSNEKNFNPANQEYKDKIKKYKYYFQLKKKC